MPLAYILVLLANERNQLSNESLQTMYGKDILQLEQNIALLPNCKKRIQLKLERKHLLRIEHKFTVIREVSLWYK